jgi:hypothetical protein
MLHIERSELSRQGTSMTMTDRVELLLAGLAGTIIGILALALLRGLTVRDIGTRMPTPDQLLLGFLVLGAFTLGALVAYVVISGIP